jgi:hypothetical protein
MLASFLIVVQVGSYLDRGIAGAAFVVCEDSGVIVRVGFPVEELFSDFPAFKSDEDCAGSKGEVASSSRVLSARGFGPEQILTLSGRSFTP